MTVRDLIQQEICIDVVDDVCESAQPTDMSGTIPANKQPVIETIRIYTDAE